MATRVFSDEELAQLRGFPEITRDELIRFFTLTSANRAFVDPGRGRSARDRLGLAVQLCTLPWLGFVPDDVTAAPPAVVTRLAEQLHVDAGALAGYGEREQTRTLSSSDGQRFPAKGKSITARALSRYFADEGLSTYTHLTDQHAVYGTKVIVATDRGAPYVLDEILGNQTDLPITEHATDTHGVAWPTSPCSTCAGCSCPPASATWARSPSTALGAAARCAPSSR